MSRAEEQALKAYPVEMEYNPTVDVNESCRELYLEGYNQAQQDLMEKAKQWFTEYLPSEKVQLLWSEFEQFITEN